MMDVVLKVPYALVLALQTTPDPLRQLLNHLRVSVYLFHISVQNPLFLL